MSFVSDLSQNIEIVLRNRDGRFLHTSWLLKVMCHELAHIKNMHRACSYRHPH